MSHFLKILFLSLLSILTFPLGTAFPQTPIPSTEIQFQLPLADGTTTQAVFLPTLDGRAYLVYATSSGNLGLWTMTPTNSPPPPPPPPTPPPTPVPPPPPPQPIVQKLTIAIVETPLLTTQEQRNILSDPSWRKLATEKHDFKGIIPTDLIEKATGKPPASLAPFLDRAKLHSLPWIMFTTETGTIIWEGNIPSSAAELKNLITKFGG